MRNVSFFVFALEALSLTVFAGGFQINAHNAASIGRGLAGESALAESASSIGLNPALGSYLDGSHLSFGLVYLDLAASADGTVNSPFAPTPLPAKDGDLGPDAFIPHAYYLHELNDRVSLGLSLNTHFGLGVDYDDRFAATDFANLGEITTIYLSPSVSVQANPQLSLGFGVSLIQAESELETTVADYQQAAFEQLAGLRPERVLRLKGDDTAFGFNLGLAWRPREDLTLGLSYRAETDLDFRAKVSSDLDDLAPLDPAFAAAAAFDGTGRSEITLPAASEAALAWNVNDDWMLSASAYHVGWSSVESLSVELPAVPDGQELERLEWKDIWRYSVGAAYQTSPTLTLRCGIAFDESPTTDEHRTLGIPDSDKIWYSVGASKKLNEKYSLDLGYSFLKAERGAISQGPSFLDTTFEGSAGIDAHAFAVSVHRAL